MWEEHFNLLVLHGAEWTSYRWSTGEDIVSTRVIFEPISEFAVSHATCAGEISAVFVGDTMHFFFRGTNGLIYEITRSGPDWKLFDLSAYAGGDSSATPVRPSCSDLAVIEVAGVIHIFFIGVDNRLRELYKGPMRGWRHVSLRRHLGGGVCYLPPQTRPFTCVDAEGCLHVFFKNEEGLIGECYWKLRRSKWRVYDTSEFVPRHGIVQTIFDVSADEGPHIFFLSLDGKLQTPTFHHVFWAEDSWISSYWGTKEGIQAFNDFDPSHASSSSSSGAPTSPNLTIYPSSSDSTGTVSPPPPPGPPPASNKKTFKIASAPVAAKPPLVVAMPMKEGSYRKEMHKYKPVRLVIISDTHNYPEKMGPLPKGDILVHCGDFTVYGKESEIQSFIEWLDEQTQFAHKIVIAGNHEVNPSKAKKLLSGHCIWLDDKSVDVMGLTFHGTTWSCDYSKLPTKGIDVLITHKPPTGHGDIIYTGQSRGSDHLAASVQRLKPLLHLFGHNHEGFGATCDTHTVYLNAATCLGSAKSSARRGSIVVDVYPDLKSKYGNISSSIVDDFSSSNTESLVNQALDDLPS